MNIELCRMLRKNFPEAEIHAAVYNPSQINNLEKYSRHYGVKFNSIIADCFSKYICLPFDIIISTGGDFISDFWHLTPRISNQLEYAKKHGKSTVLAFQTIGPFYDSNKIYAEKLLKNCDLALMREPLSLELAKSLGAKNASLTADIAFLLQDTPAQNKGKTMGVNLRGGEFYRKRAISSAIALSKKLGLKIRAYSSDIFPDKPILDLFKEKGYSAELNEFDYRSISQSIAENDCLTFTDRYHGAIFSLLAGVPVILVRSYEKEGLSSKKLKGLMLLSKKPLKVFDSPFDSNIELYAKSILKNKPNLGAITLSGRRLFNEGSSVLISFINGKYKDFKAFQNI